MAISPETPQGVQAATLDTCLDGRHVWRLGGSRREPVATGLPTGFPGLDAALPEAGWPRAALSEFLSSGPEQGTLGLLLPALAGLGRDGAWIAWVGPPHIPYAPALAAAGLDPQRQLVIPAAGESEALWVAEQIATSGACGAVLLWADPRRDVCLRRLQLAAQAGRTPVFLHRPDPAAERPSPAALRIKVAPGRALILKARGGRPRRVALD